MKKEISILTPTRNRPQGVKEFCESVFQNADNPNQIEILFYFDIDDNHINDCLEYFKELSLKYSDPIKFVVGPKLVLSNYHNFLYKIASADIFMCGADDLRFRTKGWDSQVIDVFDKYLDKILLVWFDDGYHGFNLATHPLVHRNWFKGLGYFLPPIFDAGFADNWVTDIAKKINRTCFIPSLVEHMHPNFGKNQIDKTYEEKFKIYHINQELYNSTEHLRQQDIEKLLKLINNE